MSSILDTLDMGCRQDNLRDKFVDRNIVFKNMWVRLSTGLVWDAKQIETG